MKQSGGSIWVSSKPGEGTAFKIYFPHVEKPSEEVVTGAWLGEAPGGSETILVVEDEEMVRRLVCETLQRKGYRVLEAANGEEGLLVCKQQPFPIHIMVTDVVMPGMNGRKLANIVASIRPAMKVLFMSGYSEDAVVSDGVLDPGLNFIQKTLRSGGAGVESARGAGALRDLFRQLRPLKSVSSLVSQDHVDPPDGDVSRFSMNSESLFID